MRGASLKVYAVAAFLPLALLCSVPFVADQSFMLVGTMAVTTTWLVCALFVLLVLRSSTVPREKRGLWVAVILLGNAFAFPFFWFWYLRGSENVSST